MCLGKVHDVDIVPQTGAVRSRVVVAENAQAGAFAYCSLGDERHEVVRHSAWKFSDESRRMCAYRIEIPQRNALDRTLSRSPCIHLGAVSRRSLDYIPEYVLADLLGVSVRGCGALAWRLLGHRQFVGLTVNRCR